MAQMLTKTDYAYSQIRELILSGTLGAGEVIPQGRLAQELGLSTTPLREAIRRLSAEGLVDVAAHRDARVASLTATEAMHLYEVRESLDPLAAALAAERRTDEDIAEIQRRLAVLEPVRPGDVETLMAHRAFHRAIHLAAHNPILAGSLEQLWDKADRYRALGSPDSPTAADQRRITAEHRDLAQAVVAGDAERASHVMLAHITGSHGRRAIEALAAEDAAG